MHESSGSSSNSDEFELSSGTSTSSDDDLYAVVYRPRKIKNEDYLQVTVPRYTDIGFIEHFRVSREVANNIAGMFQNSVHFFYQSGEFGKVSPLDYTIIFLRFAGHEAASYRDVSDRFGIAISTLRKVVVRMTYFLSNLSRQIITWPTPEEKVIISQHFTDSGFPGVLGAIDGSHVRLDKPSQDPDSYLNRKHFYSMQFQVVCDHRRKIRDIMVGFPGSVHDSRVFRASPLSETLPEKCQEGYILGDSGYPCTRHLLTPFRDRGNLNRRQQNYNLKLAKNRYVIEHCFGLLKQKFMQLYHLKLRNDRDIANFIRACCVLHNLALEDDFPIVENDAPAHLVIIQDEHNYYAQHDENQDERDGIEMRNYVSNILLAN